MKVHRFLLLGCVVLAGLVAGCRSTYEIPDPRVTVDPALRRDLVVSRFITMQNQANLTQVQANLRNLRYGTLPLEVKVDWFDANGMVQESLSSNWKYVSVSRQTEYPLKATAPNEQATDFRVYIRQAKRN